MDSMFKRPWDWSELLQESVGLYSNPMGEGGIGSYFLGRVREPSVFPRGNVGLGSIPQEECQIDQYSLKIVLDWS